LNEVILIVDDDKSVIRTFSKLLQKAGYVTETAETGKEAIEKISKRFYDVVLIDFRLPDMDGTNLLGKIPDHLVNSVKIIITGFPSLDLGANALDMGIDAYLVKPVNPSDLLLLISEKLKSKKS
jgi:two-component system, NtrC family, response regulator HydG